jgi:hypothetical protein
VVDYSSEGILVHRDLAYEELVKVWEKETYETATAKECD